jgi:hypothetical protein
MVDRELDGRLNRRGREVVRDLEEGTPVQEELRRMRDEIGELRSLASTLRERLDHLEARDRPRGQAKKKKRKKKR